MTATEFFYKNLSFNNWLAPVSYSVMTSYKNDRAALNGDWRKLSGDLKTVIRKVSNDAKGRRKN
ncbi:MAG: hypothetical protein SPL30_05875 [Succinivibrio sp.]|nr:hypothetical protein [Succinivibrio sp.]